MIGRQSFQAKHGTAERWHVCDCEDCLAGLGIVTCPAPAPTFAGPVDLGQRVRDNG